MWAAGTKQLSISISEADRWCVNSDFSFQQLRGEVSVFIFISFVSIYHRYWIPITGVGLLLVTAGNLNFIIECSVNTQMASNIVFRLLFCLFVFQVKKKGFHAHLKGKSITFHPVSTIIYQPNNSQYIIILIWNDSQRYNGICVCQKIWVVNTVGMHGATPTWSSSFNKLILILSLAGYDKQLISWKVNGAGDVKLLTHLQSVAAEMRAQNFYWCVTATWLARHR